MASWTESFPGNGSTEEFISVAGVTEQTWVEAGILDTDANHTKIAAAGNVKSLTPLNSNGFAVFGRVLSEFDSGRMQFTVGRVQSAGGQGNWFYGVIFNVQRNALGTNDASGYAVFVRATTGRLFLEKKAAAGGLTTLRGGTGDEVTVAVGDEVEVIWGPRGITGKDHYIQVYVNGSEVFTSEDTSHTLGYVGIAARTEFIDVTSGNLLITDFEFEEFGRPLADYGTTTSGAGADIYKGVAGRLYTDGSTQTNTVPAALRARVLRAAARLQPLSLARANENAVYADFVHGAIGVVNSGISNSGDFFNSLLPRLSNLSRNGALVLVNGARELGLADKLASRTNDLWNDVFDRVKASGLSTGATTDVGKTTSPIRSFPQVQVVISSIVNQWKSDGSGGGELFDDNAEEYRDNWLGATGMAGILPNMKKVFPNLRLVLLHNGNTVWWSGNAGGGPEGAFAEPGLGEFWKWGMKYVVRDQPTGTDDAVLDWLTELWRNTDVWTQSLIRSDGAHPNAAGEDFGVAGAALGAAALKPAFLAHYGSQSWWPQTVYHRPTTLIPDANTYTARVSTTIDPDLLKTGDRGGSNQRYTTFLRFDARSHPAPVRRALLNLYTTEPDTSLACEVVAVSSRLSGGALWDASLTESDGDSLATLGANALQTSESSRSHPVTVDVTDLFNARRGSYLSIRLRTTTITSGSAEGYSWYSSTSSDADPKRPPQLILIEKGIDEPLAYLERAVDSVLAERLR